MGTKTNPGEYDCYSKAADDEPIFIMRGKDAAASQAVRYWCLERVKTSKNRADDPQIREAYECAKAMDAYRENLNKPTDGSDLI